MTEPAYRITRGGLTADEITTARAQEIYEQAMADASASGLTGDPIGGFTYDVVDSEGVKVGRIRVAPVGVDPGPQQL